jgi:hypothetical protein
MGNKTSPSKPIHVFKPGRHTTWKGETIEFSQADLEAAAAAYSPALCKAPLVIGHPAIDDPALGWAASLQVNEKGLFAVPEQVDPAFAQEVKDGRWGAVSVKWFRPTDPQNPKPGVWYPRHIGFLGAATPGVKGLEAPAFAAGDDGVCFTEGVAFSEWDDVTNASLWRQVREWLIGKFGQDEADRVVPNYQVQSLEQAAQDELREAAAEASTTAAPVVAFSAPSNPSNPSLESIVTPQEKAALEAENQRLRAQLRAAQAAEASQASVAFCDQLINEGRLLPAYQGVVVATLNHFATQDAPVEFGEGEAKAPLADGFKALLQSLPTQVALGEVATAAAAAGQAADVEFASPDGRGVSAAGLSRHRKALAYMKEHEGASYIQAVTAVS